MGDWVHDRGAATPPLTLLPAALTVAEFCARYRVSRSKLYQLWEGGEGPDVFRIGRAVRISVPAAEEWRQRRESLEGQRRGARSVGVDGDQHANRSSLAPEQLEEVAL